MASLSLTVPNSALRSAAQLRGLVASSFDGEGMQFPGAHNIYHVAIFIFVQGDGGGWPGCRVPPGSLSTANWVLKTLWGDADAIPAITVEKEWDDSSHIEMIIEFWKGRPRRKGYALEARWGRGS